MGENKILNQHSIVGILLSDQDKLTNFIIFSDLIKVFVWIEQKTESELYRLVRIVLLLYQKRKIKYFTYGCTTFPPSYRRVISAHIQSTFPIQFFIINLFPTHLLRMK